MDCSMPGLPVHHQLPEFTQIHVHWVGDAIKPSHPLSSSSPAFSLSQHQGLFQRVSSSHQVAKVLEFQNNNKKEERTHTMSKKHIQKPQHHYLSDKCKSEPLWYTFTSIRVAVSRKKDNKKCWQECGKTGPFIHWYRNVVQCSYSGK